MSYKPVRRYNHIEILGRPRKLSAFIHDRAFSGCAIITGGGAHMKGKLDPDEDKVQVSIASLAMTRLYAWRCFERR